MIAFYIIIAALVLFAVLRFKLSVEYSEDGFIIKAYVGPVGLSIFPIKEKKRAAPGKKKRKEKKRKQKPKKPREKKPGALQSFKEMLPAIKKILGRIRKRLLINNLTIHYIAAGADDPAKAAMTFGRINAAIGIIMPVLDKAFRIRRRDLRANADFDAKEPLIYIKAALSLAVWEALYISAAILPILIAFSKSRKTNTGKDGNTDGKAPNQRTHGDDYAKSQGDG